MLHNATTAALPFLQAQAESRMPETFIIDRPTTTGDVDDDGKPIVTATTVYEGPGRIRSFRPYEQNPDVGGGTVTQQRTDWHIPAYTRLEAGAVAGVTTWAGPVQTGDRARRITPGRPSKTVRIAGEHDITDQTAQRFTVDEATGGAWSQETIEEDES